MRNITRPPRFDLPNRCVDRLLRFLYPRRGRLFTPQDRGYFLLCPILACIALAILNYQSLMQMVMAVVHQGNPLAPDVSPPYPEPTTSWLAYILLYFAVPFYLVFLFVPTRRRAIGALALQLFHTVHDITTRISLAAHTRKPLTVIATALALLIGLTCVVVRHFVSAQRTTAMQAVNAIRQEFYSLPDPSSTAMTAEALSHIKELRNRIDALHCPFFAPEATQMADDTESLLRFAEGCLGQNGAVTLKLTLPSGRSPWLQAWARLLLARHSLAHSTQGQRLDLTIQAHTHLAAAAPLVLQSRDARTQHEHTTLLTVTLAFYVQQYATLASQYEWTDPLQPPRLAPKTTTAPLLNVLTVCQDLITTSMNPEEQENAISDIVFRIVQLAHSYNVPFQALVASLSDPLRSALQLAHTDAARWAATQVARLEGAARKSRDPVHFVTLAQISTLRLQSPDSNASADALRHLQCAAAMGFADRDFFFHPVYMGLRTLLTQPSARKEFVAIARKTLLLSDADCDALDRIIQAECH